MSRTVPTGAGPEWPHDPEGNQGQTGDQRVPGSGYGDRRGAPGAPPEALDPHGNGQAYGPQGYDPRGYNGQGREGRGADAQAYGRQPTGGLAYPERGATTSRVTARKGTAPRTGVTPVSQASSTTSTATRAVVASRVTTAGATPTSATTVRTTQTRAMPIRAITVRAMQTRAMQTRATSIRATTVRATTVRATPTSRPGRTTVTAIRAAAPPLGMPTSRPRPTGTRDRAIRGATRTRDVAIRAPDAVIPAMAPAVALVMAPAAGRAGAGRAGARSSPRSGFAACAGSPAARPSG